MRSLDATAIALDGTNLIEASAGTGKTYTISTLYLRLLLERELDVEEILVVTYTRAATAELRGRIRERLGDARAALLADADTDDPILDFLRAAHAESSSRERAITRLTAAITSFDQAAIFTIHGFCQRALQDHAFESGVPFDSDFVSDQSSLLGEVVADFWACTLDESDETFVRHLAADGANLRSLHELAARAVADPSMPVLARERSGESEDRAGNRSETWSEALARVRDQWREDRDEVLDLLVAATERKDLDGRSFKNPLIQGKFADELERGLSSASPRRLTDPLLRFTTEHLASKTTKNGTMPTHSFFEACSELALANSRLLEELEDRVAALWLDLIGYARRELPERKARAGVQSYDDLLTCLQDALRGSGGERLAARIRARYRAALIDEFQDTDAVQYEILRRVWHSPVGASDDRSLFLIGDPKQAIYAFRGADVFAYLRAKSDAGSNAHTLDVNWRSDPSLIRAVNGLFSRGPDPFLIDGISFEGVRARAEAKDQLEIGPAFEILVLRGEEGLVSTSGKSQGAIKKTAASEVIPDRVAAEIAGLLDGPEKLAGRDIVPSDLAILCRTNLETEAIRGALESRGIPAAVVGGASVWDAPEAAQLERVLAAMADPADRRGIRLALATPILGLRGEQIDSLLHDESAAGEWIERFQEWHQIWSLRGFVPALHQMLADAEVHARLLGLRDGERRLTNLLHLAELLERQALERHLGPLGLVSWLERMRLDGEARAGGLEQEDLLRLEGDAEAVTVVTIHKSKGMEYPIVVCPYLWDGSLLRRADKQWLGFHDPDDDFQRKLDLGSDAHARHLEQAEDEALAEGLRILYVALTRARHRCSIVWGRFGSAETSPLAHLLHSLPPDESSDEAPVPAADRFPALDEEEIVAELFQIAKASGGSIEVRDLVRDAERPELPASSLVELVRRIPKRILSARWRHSSFSALTTGGSEFATRSPDPVESSFDYDALLEGGASDLSMAGSHEGAEVSLDHFPAGAAAGTFLHTVLEKLDFSDFDPAASKADLERKLERAGFETHWSEVLAASLDEILKVRWGAESEAPALHEIDRDRRLDELEFLLPVGGGKSGGDESGEVPLAVGALADVFAAYAKDDFVRAYAERIRELRFLPLAGYLKGFIDLVFERKGRFHLVDYKSNHLGSTASCYLPEHLRPVMVDHHYVLQYHLYLVALHRYLSLRLPDYDYDRHVGSAYYLFLRGMALAHPSGCGVYEDRPPRELIEGLSRLLAGEGGGLAS